MRHLFYIILLILPFSLLAEENKTPSISEKTKSMKKYEGYFNFYWEENTGKVWLEIDKWQQEFLYVNSLPAGIGSNDIGLDRGQLGRGRIVKFERIGPKVLLIQPNYDFRAVSDNQAERKAVEQAFAQSTLWGFEIGAVTGENVLVDASIFYLRDAHNVVGTLAATKQGSYSLDANRSAIYLPRTKNFPLNSEVEATLTFTGKAEGAYVRQVVPSPEAITLRQHHSFVKLPDDGYKPRAQDVRSGYWNVGYFDYATPISEPLLKQFIGRHRLEKKNPEAEISEAVEPIIYYLDPGAPEPIRSALIDGALWWNEAFEAIGFRNAFQVKMLPEDADPMDVRYNVIQWVHRSTRGWSYGGGMIDPRTGEIIKGHVILGSLRVRQDYLIAQGLLSPFKDKNTDISIMQEMALARLRQLSAHEVGHTLGIIHNFSASPVNRASVMDYPHPFIQLKEDGTLDFSQAYGVGVGAWDKATIAYGYSDFPEGTNETVALNKIIDKTIADGLLFISDQDARPAGGAHPTAHLWDNGEDATDELYRILKVRKNALHRFSENSIPIGSPFSNLEEVLVPLYLSHRYQVKAVSKQLGGLFYSYAVRGDGQKITEIVSPQQQLKALEALLYALKPEVLALPESILKIIPPRAYGQSRGRENFNGRTSVTFDPLAAAETSASETATFLLHPARAARLVEYHARDAKYPGLVQMLDKILTSTWKSSHSSGYHAEIQRVVDDVILRNLLGLASASNASAQVKAIASFKLSELKQWLSKRSSKEKNTAQKAHLLYAAGQIHRFQENPEAFELPAPIKQPDGSPIGMEMMCGFDFNNE